MSDILLFSKPNLVKFVRFDNVDIMMLPNVKTALVQS